MRPSESSFSSVMRAISRRTPSKPERMTAFGVSSMMKSTPVRCSRVRMLRPSRPMMRPFMSSEGSSTSVTVVSAAPLPCLVRRHRRDPLELLALGILQQLQILLQLLEVLLAIRDPLLAPRELGQLARDVVLLRDHALLDLDDRVAALPQLRLEVRPHLHR